MPFSLRSLENNSWEKYFQITKVFSDSFELYLGVENLTNYKQSDGIISYDDPFSQYFDATMIYGPVSGRMSYLGLRYNVN